MREGDDDAWGGDARGDMTRGGGDDVRGGAGRPGEDERGEDGAGGRRRGAHSHTLMRAPLS